MSDRVNEMRKLLDSLMLPETEELNELMGFDSEKRREKYNKKVDKKKANTIFITLRQKFKEFVSGKIKAGDNNDGKKLNPKDPNTIARFLNLVGFDLDVARSLVREDFTKVEAGTLIQEQLLNEFFGNGSVDDILKKAAVYSVENGVPLGTGQPGKIDAEPQVDSDGKKGKADKTVAAAATDDGDPGLDKLETQIVGLIKRISPKAAEILDVKLYDGLDLKAEQIKSLVERNPNNAVNLLALVGFAYLNKRMKSSIPAEAPTKAPSTRTARTRSVDIK